MLGDACFFEPWWVVWVVVFGVVVQFIGVVMCVLEWWLGEQIGVLVEFYVYDYSILLVDAVRCGDLIVRSAVLLDEGKCCVDVICGWFDGFVAVECARYVVCEVCVDVGVCCVILIVIVGFVGLVLLIALVIVYMTWVIVLLVCCVAVMVRWFAGGELVTRMLVSGVGEVGTLQCFFNLMVGLLEVSCDELWLFVEE